MTNEYRAKAYGAQSADGELAPMEITRRGLRGNDVLIDITHCGICHSDLHQARNDWGNSVYPLVPGHEIVGTVAAVGDDVTLHKVGDAVAVGCMVDSCGECPACLDDQEMFCYKQSTGTYNGKDKVSGGMTYGGYSDKIVVRDNFVLKLPDGLDIAKAAPILCAGITCWTPLREWNVGQGSKVAVIGLGGLGHMGVKLAVGLGADVTVITTSPEKAEQARQLGAHDVLISSDRDAMKAARGRFEFILDTVPVQHDLSPYLMVLRNDGSLVMVGAIDMVPSFHSGLLLGGRKRISGSAIGGIRPTQELLDFCAEKNILPEVEEIAIEGLAEAFERMEKGDVRFRFVIDMESLKTQG